MGWIIGDANNAKYRAKVFELGNLGQRRLK